MLLKCIADSLILRRTKKDKFPGTDKCIVELPEKKVVEVRFQLSPSEKTVYQKLFKECKEKLKGFFNSKKEKVFIFVYILRLRQACCHLSLFNNCLDKNKLICQVLEDELNKVIVVSEQKLKILKKYESEKLSELICEQNQTVSRTAEVNDCMNRSYMSSKMEKSISMVVQILEDLYLYFSKVMCHFPNAIK